jgi:hypothetical protein
MATLPLLWKEGEGYDIHVLRGGPASKALDGSLLLDQSTNALPPVFAAHFKGAPNNFGVDVNTATGEVTASPHPGSDQPKFPNFNFLMTARQVVGGAATYETKIRIHIHDSIEKIWLTPSTLTVHVGSDEHRFTVLALFDDGTVGDITDWPQPHLTFKSSDANIVDVLPGMALQAKTAGKDADVTVTLNLTSPSVTRSDTRKVFTRPGWDEVGKNAKAQFVTGPITPNESDLYGNTPDSVDSVIKARTNILFVSEGFLKNQEPGFRKAVADVVNSLRTEKFLEPFSLLKDSINYWSVFVASREEGISVLGDQEIIGGSTPMGAAIQVQLPRQPAPSAAEWTVANMVHEGGLPLPREASVQGSAAWASSRRKLYDIPASAPLPSGVTRAKVEAWNDLRSRTLLNERDSAFGLAHCDRPRASGQDAADGRLALDPRRTSEASLQMFLENLKFGQDPDTSTRYSIGETWVEDRSGAGGGKDFPLVCFVCQSDTRGGAWTPVDRTVPYFTASTGRGFRALVKAAVNGHDLSMLPIERTLSLPLFASLVAYGCGRALRLRDEDGDGEGTIPGPTTLVSGENVQAETLIVSTSSGARSIDGRKIAWLWPRIVNAGVVKVDVDINNKVLSPQKCDPFGIPDPTGSFVLVRFQKSPPKPFAKGDRVRLRASMMKSGAFVYWQNPSQDAFAAFPFFVEHVLNDGVVLSYQTPQLPQLGYLDPSGPQLDLLLFKDVVTCLLIAPRIVDVAEIKLIADPIWRHIDSSDSPLNARLFSQGEACRPALHARADVTPENLPQGLKLPKDLPSKADIVGIYDGGAHFDCGVYRPAGRCRMRRGLDATTPFCHVCRYIIVDRVDPTRHGLLDDLYELQYPR